MSRSRKPLVGVTLDSEQPGGYSVYPWYALRTNYAAPLPRPAACRWRCRTMPALAADMLDAIDALVVTGGAFDVDPGAVRRGGRARHRDAERRPHRRRSARCCEGALARDMPVLGICGGEQLLAVALGGTLIQHIPDSVPTLWRTSSRTRATRPGHGSRVMPGTLLHRIVGRDTMQVNSSHHQAVREAGPRRRGERARAGRRDRGHRRCAAGASAWACSGTRSS